ncbi:MAG: DUF4058 family protein, partial [Fimbriiglobus sp.]
PDRERYLAKRDEVLAANTSLVEIDLLRDGERPPLGKPSPPAGDYRVVVCRSAEYPRAAVWAFTVRDPIPAVPVPLKPGAADVGLDLQRLASDIYDAHRYADRVDYATPITPALRPADAAWAVDVLKNHARKRK